jgi:hypothetical protein
MVRRLSAVQGFSDFAKRKKGAGSGFFNFQSLFVVTFNEPDEPVQYRQRFWRRLSFCQLQGFKYLIGCPGISHFANLPDKMMEHRRLKSFAANEL